MKSKTKSSGLIGATVLIDWPMRWKRVDPRFREGAFLEAKKNEAHFGEVGTIAGWTPGDESGKEYEIALASGEVERFHHGAFTVTAPAPVPDAQVVQLLQAILEVLKGAKQ